MKVSVNGVEVEVICEDEKQVNVSVVNDKITVTVTPKVIETIRVVEVAVPSPYSWSHSYPNQFVSGIHYTK